jgi:hypothetical protein
MNNTLGSPVLRSVGVGEMHGDVMAEEEVMGGGIIKFTPIIALNTFDGAAELGFNIGKKICVWKVSDLRWGGKVQT